MEIFISACLGEIAARSTSFLIDRYLGPPAPPLEDSLQRALLRAESIVEEAAGRSIANRAMLRQLSMLTDAMHRGYYVLDTFRYQADDHPLGQDQDVAVSHRSRALSKFSFATRLSSSGSSKQTARDILDRLQTMILDARELVVFLESYPRSRLYRQPYSMHLLLDKCMFNRQMEMQRAISFLLQTQPKGGNEFDVLPIVGPAGVGKSTLVAHICNDERVRDHFSRTVLFGEDDFTGESLQATLADRFGVGHQNCTINERGRLLVVVEVTGELDEDAWEKLCLASKGRATSGSKIIITSRLDKINRFGTTHALTLEPLSHEAYWYFFKVITFGSTDPEMHPKHAYLAMEIARNLKRSFLGANIISTLLRTNFDIHFWCAVLVHFREFIGTHLTIFREHPSDLLHTNKPRYVRRMGTSTEDLFISDYYHTWLNSEEEFPKITFQDVVSGNTKPRGHGTFKVLAWRSHIPPYNCCIYTCQIRELQTKIPKRKRCLDNSLKSG